METFIQADIFFFVTTIAIIVITLLFSLLLLYGISFSRNIYKLSSDIKKEADAILGVVGKVRGAVNERSINVMALVTKVVGMVQANKPKRKKKAEKKVKVKVKSDK
jgi:hypothetical protein